MGWFIAIFAVFVVTGSVAWIKPSKRDLRLTSLRRCAMSLGLRVRLLDEKTKANLFPWLPDHRGYALYELHGLKLCEERPMRSFEVHSDEQMHELDRLRMDVAASAISALEARLPKGIKAVVLYPDGAGLLWNEQGEESMVESFVPLIKEAHDLVS